MTLPNVYAFILTKLLIALMGFSRLGAVFYPETAHECTQSKQNEVCHAWYVVSQYRLFDSRVLKG